MTTEMIARVGMALCESALAGKQCPCRETGTFACDTSHPGIQARAAIRATLEPTDETLDRISWHFGAAMMQLPSDDFHDELARNLLSDLRRTALGEDEGQ